jgi:hypothetical protein
MSLPLHFKWVELPCLYDADEELVLSMSFMIPSHEELRPLDSLRPDLG